MVQEAGEITNITPIIDLAVYSEGKLSPELWPDLDEAVGIYKIDVIDMNSPLDEKLRQRIEEEGVEIYSRIC